MPRSVNAVVAALLRARLDGVPANAAPLTGALASAADAEAVHAGVAQALGWWAGGVPRYWKSGGPDRASACTHAALPPAGVWPGPAQAGAWPFALRGVEAEIALRLGQAVSQEAAASLQPDTAAQWVDAMAVAIEIVDSRWAQQLGAPALLKMADAQCHGALVLGAWQPFAARDWSQQICRTRITGQDEVLRQGTHALGDPAWLLPQWLRHVTQRFGTVPAGTVVTTGNWVGALMARPGDRVEVAFDGLGSTSVQL